MAGVLGVLLAAGAGRRMGGPKALVVEGGTPWIASSARMLLEAGCEAVVVVLGAGAEKARPLLPVDPRVRAIVAEDWAEGLSASLRAGLAAAAGPGPGRGTAAVLVSLVDLPGLPAAAGARVIERMATGGALPRALARAVYDGRPGHPVLIGREHWAGVAAAASGDRGAGAYLGEHGALAVECGDLGDGLDRDR